MSDRIWEYRDDLERLARHLCRHPEDAADVAQTALLKAAEKLDGFRGEASLRTWLHRIATNECRMMRRRRAPSSLDALFDDVAEGRAPERVETAPDPEEIVLDLEARESVLAALETLPDRHRCVLLLVDGNGLSYRQAAQVMGVSDPALRSLLFRARAALREALEGE